MARVRADRSRRVRSARDGHRAGLGDISPGDRALVVLDRDGLVERIEALSGREGTPSPAAWLAPLLLGLWLAALFWWFLARPREPFIVQRGVGRAGGRGQI